MKLFIPALLAVFFHTSLLATSINPSVKAPLKTHLLEINKNWQGKPSSEVFIAFNSDDDRIQAHLFGVLDYLKENTPQGFGEKALENRKELLDELALYAEAKRFPRNTGHEARTPYFIDEFNTACAVGNLIIQAGDEELALSLKDNFNFNYIAEMPQELIEQWARKKGFDVWELEWIQPGYAYYPTTRFQQKNTQLISPVNKVNYITDLQMTCYASSGENVFASAFNCVKDDGTFLDYGYNLNGNPMDFEYGFDGKMVVGGEFNYGDSTYGLAFLEDPDTRTYWNMPNQEKYITKAVLIDGNTLYFSAELSDTSTLIYSWDASQPFPTQVATVNGRVNALEYRVSQLFIAGEFTSATNGNGSVSNCNNIVWLQSNILNPMAEGFDGFVNQLRLIDWEIYAVGFCDNINDSTKGSCAKKWTIDQWESLISDSSDIDLSIDSAQIFDIVNYHDTLVFGSNFRISSFSDMWNLDAGRALGVIHADKSVASKSFINGLVNSLTINGNGLLEIGGDFSSYTYHYPGGNSIQYKDEGLMMAGEIAYGLVGTEEIETPEISLFPNPTNDFIQLTSATSLSDIKIFDLSGQLVLSERITASNQAQVDLSNLSKGNYIIEVKADERLWRKQFTVN